MKKLRLLILCTAATLDTAAAPLSLAPEAGPHAVGLHILQQYDYSRAMEVQLDAFGKPLPVSRGRAIQTLVWYPARKVAGPACR